MDPDHELCQEVRFWPLRGQKSKLSEQSPPQQHSHF